MKVISLMRWFLVLVTLPLVADFVMVAVDLCTYDAAKANAQTLIATEDIAMMLLEGTPQRTRLAATMLRDYMPHAPERLRPGLQDAERQAAQGDAEGAWYTLTSTVWGARHTAPRLSIALAHRHLVVDVAESGYWLLIVGGLVWLLLAERRRRATLPFGAARGDEMSASMSVELADRRAAQEAFGVLMSRDLDEEAADALSVLAYLLEFDEVKACSDAER